ncbi:MAG: hypothetical protein DYG98_18635 [Haliscomenobacteraceae bacterium CHB4]|nr:hypothetical protein [Saprospiraceae bacterium]MCE7925075.1 hypothetical protein [Haliscomenobacteraceae bacterium CHB4]
MKLQKSIPIIFIALLGLLVLSKIKQEWVFAAMAIVPLLVIWQVVIALRHKEPAQKKGEAEDKWYENP